MSLASVLFLDWAQPIAEDRRGLVRVLPDILTYPFKDRSFILIEFIQELSPRERKSVFSWRELTVCKYLSSLGRSCEVTHQTESEEEDRAGDEEEEPIAGKHLVPVVLVLLVDECRCAHVDLLEGARDDGELITAISVKFNRAHYE